MARKLSISLQKLMWQELPPDSRANKKVANAIYHFKKPYVGGYEHFSAAASSSQKGVRMMSSLNQWQWRNAAGKAEEGCWGWDDGRLLQAPPPLQARGGKPRPRLQASALPLPGSLPGLAGL